MCLLGVTTVLARKQVWDVLGVVLDGMVYPDCWQCTAVNRFVGPFSPSWELVYFKQLCVDLLISEKTKYRDLCMGTKM